MGTRALSRRQLAVLPAPQEAKARVTACGVASRMVTLSDKDMSSEQGA